MKLVGYGRGMRYLVYGAGAVGGVIGGNLFRAGRDVTLLARGAHLEALRAGGLRLDTIDGVLTLPIPSVASAAEVSWTEDTVVMLCVKGQDTADALEDLVEHAPAETIVVSAQNGIANEREILRRFARTYAVPVLLPATHLEPGLVVQDGALKPGVLDIGRYPRGTDEISAAILADLRAAGFGGTQREDVMAWKRRKLINNLGNALDAAVAPGPAFDELAARVRAEGEAVFAATGDSLATAEQDEANRAGQMDLRTDVARAGGSTRQSLARGTGVETDFLTGEVVLLGRLHGVPTPANELAQRTVHDLVRGGGEPGSVEGEKLLLALGE